MNSQHEESIKCNNCGHLNPADSDNPNVATCTVCNRRMGRCTYCHSTKDTSDFCGMQTCAKCRKTMIRETAQDTE